MSALKPHSEPGWGRTANDVFKSRSKRRLWWSFAVAAGFHGLLLAWSPTWVREGPPDPSPAHLGTELLALLGDDGSIGGILPGPIAAREVQEAPAPEGSGQDEEPVELGLPDWSLANAYAARGSEALRAELERRAQPAPTLAEPELDPEASQGAAEGDVASEDGGDGSARIGGMYSLSEYEALTEDELLALESLSALRPELAFTSPSLWILARNPSDMEDFLKERFTGPGQGIVSVAMWIDERGSVEWAEIQRSSGRQEIDESALELFREVVAFRPARRGGMNVPMAVVLSVPFPW